MQIHFEEGEAPVRPTEIRGYELLRRNKTADAYAHFKITSDTEPRVASRIIDVCSSQHHYEMAYTLNKRLHASAARRPQLFQKVDLLQADLDAILLWSAATTLRNEIREKSKRAVPDRITKSLIHVEKSLETYLLPALLESPTKVLAFLDVLLDKNILTSKSEQFIKDALLSFEQIKDIKSFDQGCSFLEKIESRELAS